MAAVYFCIECGARVVKPGTCKRCGGGASLVDEQAPARAKSEPPIETVDVKEINPGKPGGRKRSKRKE